MEKKILEHLESMCSQATALEIVSIDKIEDNDAMYVVFLFDGERQVAIYYPTDDILFTPTDWQSGCPDRVKDLADYDWRTSAGDMGFILNGLPRCFSAIRDEARKAFGDRVKNLRKEQGLSADQLAQRAGLQRPNLLRIESGRYNVTLDTITRLSAALGVSLID